MSTLEDVYNEWQNNAVFREQFHKDPVAALRAFHFDLSPADLEKMIHTMDKLMRDNNELTQRSSE